MPERLLPYVAFHAFPLPHITDIQIKLFRFPSCADQDILASFFPPSFQLSLYLVTVPKNLLYPTCVYMRTFLI